MLEVWFTEILAITPAYRIIGSPLKVIILHWNCRKIVKIDSKHHKLAIYISNTDNCERATRLLRQRYDVYSKYHKVGNSFNLLKYTHTNKPVVYQKQTKNGFKNNININKDNFTNLLATFFVNVQLEKSTNERNFSIFCRCFACDYAGCSHPTTGQIFKSKTWLFIGSRNFCRVQGIARANEQSSFTFKNLSSSRMRASRIVTSKTSAKYRKISFICGLFKLYIDKKKLPTG